MSDSITFTVNGFAGFADPVNYSITSALPPGISAVWNTGRDRPVMLTVSAASNAQPGLYDLTVMANSGKLTSSATIQMRVLAPGYVINLTPVPTAIAQGGSFTGTVSLALEGGFNGAVSLTAPQFPQGVSVTFNPPSISGTQTSQLTLAVSGSAPVGAGNLSLLGTTQGYAAFYSIPLNVLASPVPNFSLTASPTALAIAQGGSGSTTITVNPLDGFASGVSLNIPGFPGVTSSFSVNPTASSSIATVNVANSVPAGSYWLRFSGSSAALTAPGSIFLQVTPTYPFDMDITPDPISLVAGGAGSGNVTITPHSSLSENVDLTVISELPDGISASFSPASTEAHSSLLISAGSAVAAGNYQFNVAGTARMKQLQRR